MDENTIKLLLLRIKDGFLQLTTIEEIEVVKAYIYEKKGVKQEINQPTEQLQFLMLNHCFDIAARYYMKKLFKTEVECSV